LADQCWAFVKDPELEGYEGRDGGEACIETGGDGKFVWSRGAG